MSHFPGPNFWLFLGCLVALIAMVALGFLIYLGLLDEADQAASASNDTTRDAMERRQIEQFLAAERDHITPRHAFRQEVTEAHRWRGNATRPANDPDGFAQRIEVQS